MEQLAGVRQLFQQAADIPRRSDLAYRVIRDAIAFGRVKPGEWLRQDALAQELNVSAVTIREALGRLVTEGLAVHTPYKGVKVVALPAEEMDDLWELRALIEGFALELAAGRITPGELAKLRELLPRNVVRGGLQSAEDAWDANREFHSVAVGACRRRHLIRIHRQLLDLTNPYFLLHESGEQIQYSSAEGELREHAQILEALEKGDGKTVRQLVTEHILSTLDLVKKLLAQQS
jgi:DNA-binding GntR family transcriptional regulator